MFRAINVVMSKYYGFKAVTQIKQKLNFSKIICGIYIDHKRQVNNKLCHN